MGNKFCNCNDCCHNKKTSNLIINNRNNNNFFNYNNDTFGINEENYNNNLNFNEPRIKEIYYSNSINKIIKCYKNYKFRKDNNSIIKAKLRKLQKEKKIKNYINNIINNSNININKEKKNINFIDENNIEKNKKSSSNFLNIPSLNLKTKLFSSVNSIKKENFNTNKSINFSTNKNDFKISSYKNKALTKRKDEVNFYLSKKHNFSLLKDFDAS